MKHLHGQLSDVYCRSAATLLFGAMLVACSGKTVENLKAEHDTVDSDIGDVDSDIGDADSDSDGDSDGDSGDGDGDSDGDTASYGTATGSDSIDDTQDSGPLQEDSSTYEQGTGTDDSGTDTDIVDSDSVWCTETGTQCDVTPVTNSAEGYMSRYWDCCKPACGWESSSLARPFYSCDINNERLDSFITASACEKEDGAYACWKLAPWVACDNLSYGFVAFSTAVCGSCFQFDFTGESHSASGDPGSAALKGKTMIVQGVDMFGASDLGHFQLLIPGGGTYSFSACATQFGTSELGDPDGGFLTACNGDVECVREKCQQVFGNKPELLAGCEWSATWFHGADVPPFKFQRVECPEELMAVSGVRP